MWKYLIALVLTALATPAFAQDDRPKNYIRATVGATFDNPNQADYPRQGGVNKKGVRGEFISRIRTEDLGPAVDVAMGRDFGAVRLELAATYSRIAGKDGGCIGCGTPTAANGFAYTPSKQGGAVDRASGSINVLFDLPITKGFTVSAGGGGGFMAYMPHTHFPDKGGWRQGHGTLNPMYNLIGEVNVDLSKRVSLTGRYLRQSYKPRVYFLSDLYNRVPYRDGYSSVKERINQQQVTVGITYRFGKN